MTSFFAFQHNHFGKTEILKKWTCLFSQITALFVFVCVLERARTSSIFLLKESDFNIKVLHSNKNRTTIAISKLLRKWIDPHNLGLEAALINEGVLIVWRVASLMLGCSSTITISLSSGLAVTQGGQFSSEIIKQKINIAWNCLFTIALNIRRAALKHKYSIDCSHF